MTEAAKRAGAPRTRFYDLLKRDKRFGEEWREADAQGFDTLKDEIVRRGRDGWDEAVHQKGELAGYVRRYDSNLLLAEVRRRDPAYRDNQRLEVSGTVRGELAVGVRIEHDYEAILEGLVQAGVITRGPAAEAAIAEAKALQQPALSPGDAEPPSQPSGEPPRERVDVVASGRARDLSRAGRRAIDHPRRSSAQAPRGPSIAAHPHMRLLGPGG